MKRPDYDDYWEEPDDDGDYWLYSGYWDICVLLHKGSKEFWHGTPPKTYHRSDIDAVKHYLGQFYS